MSPMVPGFTDHDEADSSILHDGTDSAIRRTRPESSSQIKGGAETPPKEDHKN